MELVKDVHRFGNLGVRLMTILDNSVTIKNGSASSFVVEVEKKQETNPIFLEPLNAVNNQRVEVFSQERDGILRYQGRLCVPDVGELRKHILVEDHKLQIFYSSWCH